MGKFLDEKYMERALKLAESDYRPKEIIALKDKIERETKLLEKLAAEGVPVIEDAIKAVVGLRLDLDRLYTDWAEGKIE